MQLTADSLAIATTLSSFIKVEVEAVAGDLQARRKDHCRRGSLRKDQHRVTLGLPVLRQKEATVLAVTVARRHFDYWPDYPRMRSRNHSFPG